MVDHTIIPAITETIRQNEIGNASPYRLSFALLGKSGASFGFMQGDTNVSELARKTLRQVLLADHVSDADATRLVAALARPLPQGNPLSTDDTMVVSHALISQGGKAAVDAMDQQLLSVVLDNLDLVLKAAASANLSVDPVACLYAAPWINMTGRPVQMCNWVSGTAIGHVPPPRAPSAHEDDIVAYLQATAYFSAHPRNFKHLEECVMAGEKLLPPQNVEDATGPLRQVA